jgi:hypothetical protein
MRNPRVPGGFRGAAVKSRQRGGNRRGVFRNQARFPCGPDIHTKRSGPFNEGTNQTQTTPL